MYNNNQNKFNATSKSKAFFPIKQHRFDSSKHPIIQSTQKCAARMTTMLSAQEDQMLEGLANSLQCNQREAIRIALHEASRSGFKALQSTSRCARASTTSKGHAGRSRPLSVSLPKAEKHQAICLADQLELTDKEILRLAIIWLAKAIKDETITKLQDTPKLSQDSLAKQWSQTHKGEPSKLTRLKASAKAAYQKAEALGQEKDKQLYEQRGLMMQQLGDQAQLTTIDAMQQREADDLIDQIINDFKDTEALDQKEEEIFRIMCSYQIWDEQLATEIWQQEQQRKQAEALEPEMTDEMLDEWLKGIREETQDKANQPTPTPVQLTPKRPKASTTPEELIINRFFDALD